MVLLVVVIILFIMSAIRKSELIHAGLTLALRTTRPSFYCYKVGGGLFSVALLCGGGLLRS